MTIIQLPDALSNKIAAGEVVERPASVVKELVENSVDANSTWIKIELAEAGLEKIKITDNGEGMEPEDAERACLRHATSKIKRDSDLGRIRTLGFRGEALASIASVSRLQLKTSRGSEAGIMLKMEGGSVIDRGKSDARQGTEILVEDLFYNTPARLKYMKTIHTELGHVTDLLNRLALSHPEIRMEATHNGKSLFQTDGTKDVLQVIAQIYGMDVARKMIPVPGETIDFSIKGYVAKPEITRASRHYISTIVNGRYIKNFSLTQAIIRAYHTLLPIGRYPLAVLSIGMDPTLIDVNVHPTKLEVRFSKDRELFQALEDTIRDSLREYTLIPEVFDAKEERDTSVQPSFSFHRTEEKVSSDNEKHSASLDTYPTGNIQENPTPFSLMEETSFSDGPQTDVTPAKPEGTHAFSNVTDPSTPQQDRVPMIYPIGQLQGTYILGQNENGLYMIDQHAAQERIKYEFYKEKLGKTTNESQELLVPLTFELTPQEAVFVEKHIDAFQEAGIHLEAFGKNTYVVRSHPTWFPEGREEETVREIVDQVLLDEDIDIEKVREEAAILMSCKRSIKANHYLTENDMYHLLEDLRETTDPFTCPHGRPIIVHFSSYELEKMFKRVM